MGFFVLGADVVGGLGAGFGELHDGPLWVFGLMIAWGMVRKIFWGVNLTG